MSLLQEWVKNFEDYCITEIQKGKEIPGYKLVEGSSKRKWVDEADVVKFLKKQGLKKKDLYEEKLLGITKIQKELGKEGKKLLEPITITPPGKAKIVTESDKRPALVFETAEEVFKDDI